MHYFRFFLVAFCALAAVFADRICAAQAAGQAPANYPVRTLPQATEAALPFAVNVPAAEISNSIIFLSPDAMSSADLETVKSAMSGIRHKSAQAGFNLDDGNWSYQQVVCPVLPEYLLLLYTRDNGVGDVSRFSAIILREGKTEVLILPILRRSFTLYTPAPVNPLTIAVFNRIRENGQTEKKPDWLMTGLCYAALAGAHVKLVPPDTKQGSGSAVPAMAPLLQIEEGMSIVHFVDVENAQKPREWDLAFDPKGKLVKVTVAVASPLNVKMLP